MQFYSTNICQIMVFRLYTVHNKNDDEKNGNEAREKSKELSQVPK